MGLELALPQGTQPDIEDYGLNDQGYIISENLPQLISIS